MKVIKLNEEMEKTLVTIFDAALKAGGFQMNPLVNKVISSIETVPESKVDYVDAV